MVKQCTAKYFFLQPIRSYSLLSAGGGKNFRGDEENQETVWITIS